MAFNATVEKRADLIYQVQNIPGTGIWALVEKGDLLELVEKARLYDMESHDRLSYEAGKISRELALEHPISLEEMIAADVNSRASKMAKTGDNPDTPAKRGLSVTPVTPVRGYAHFNSTEEALPV